MILVRRGTLTISATKVNTVLHGQVRMLHCYAAPMMACWSLASVVLVRRSYEEVPKVGNKTNERCVLHGNVRAIHFTVSPHFVGRIW